MQEKMKIKQLFNNLVELIINYVKSKNRDYENEFQKYMRKKSGHQTYYHNKRIQTLHHHSL